MRPETNTILSTTTENYAKEPAQKWLKDRRGRKLSGEDIDHYQKIIKILLETDRIMKEIG